MRNKLKFALPLAIFSLALSGCANGGIPDYYDPGDTSIPGDWVEYEMPLTSIEFASGQDPLTLVKGGEPHTYRYSYAPRTATKNSIHWESLDESVATVENGVVTPVNKGSTKIKVTSGDKVSEELTVNVVVELNSFTIEDVDIDIQESKSLEITFDPADTSYSDINYTILEDTSDIRIENNKVIPDGKVGTYHVQAECYGKITSFTVNVTDKYQYIDEENINLELGASELEVGRSTTMSASIPEGSSTSNKMKYYTSTPELISVNETTGEITALKASDEKAKVYASIIESRGGEIKKSEEKEIEVFEIVATSISLGADSKQTRNLVNQDGQDSLQLSYEYGVSGKVGYDTPSKGTAVYSSSDESVATVSQSGLVSVVGKGDARISVVNDAYVGVSDYVDVHVNIVATSVSLSIQANKNEYYFGQSATFTAESIPAYNKISAPEVSFEITGATEDKYTKSISDNVLTLSSDEEVELTVVAKIGEMSSSAKTVRFVEDMTGNYYVVGNMNDWTRKSAYKLIQDVEDANHYYLNNIDLTLSSELQVQDWLGTYYTSATTYNGCGYVLGGEYGNNIMPRSEGTFTIDFYPNSEDGNHIKLYNESGEPEEVKYYLVGTMNGWSFNSDYVFTVDPEDNNVYTLTTNLLDTDQLKVRDLDGNWYTSSSTYAGCGYYIPEDNDNIGPDQGTGEYKITFYLDGGESNNHIKLEKNGTISDVNFYVVGSFADNNWTIDPTYQLNVSSEDGNHYYLGPVNLEANDKLKVLADTTSVGDNGWFTSKSEGTNYTLDWEKNVVVGESGLYYVDFYVSSENGNHIQLAKTTPALDEYTVTFHIDIAHIAEQFSHSIKDYSLYYFDNAGYYPVNFDAVSGNLNSGSVTITADHQITGLVFYVYENEGDSWNRKQSTDIKVNISASGEYDLVFGEELVWTTGKMSNWTYQAHVDPTPQFAITPTALALEVGDSGTITASNYGTGIQATSSNTSVATVSVNGATVTVSAVGEGSANVTVTASDNTQKVCTVTVSPAIVYTALYFNANGNYDIDGAVIFAHCWDANGQTDYKMTLVSGQTTVYTAQINSAYDHVKFYRCKPGSESLIYDGDDKTVWNATDNIEMVAGKNMWTLEGDINIPDGSWGVYDSDTVYQKNIIKVWFTDPWVSSETEVYAYVWNSTTGAKMHGYDFNGTRMAYAGNDGSGKGQFYVYINIELFDKVIFSKVGDNPRQSVEISLWDTHAANNSGYYLADDQYNYGGMYTHE